MNNPQEYIENLTLNQWHNINDIHDEKIESDVRTLILLNDFTEFDIKFSELYDYLFMKTSGKAKRILLHNLKEIEDNLDKVKWIVITTMEQENYIVYLDKDNKIEKVEATLHKVIFRPKTHIMTYFEWIRKHAKSLKIGYEL